jgi:hypothetical protein
MPHCHIYLILSKLQTRRASDYQSMLFKFDSEVEVVVDEFELEVEVVADVFELELEDCVTARVQGNSTWKHLQVSSPSTMLL